MKRSLCLKKHKPTILLSPGTAHEKIVKAFANMKVAYEEVPDLKVAVTKAFARAKRGDLILLSPGATSFGAFKSEFDRAAHFKKIVAAL